jgi:hypothetical protein
LTATARPSCNKACSRASPIAGFLGPPKFRLNAAIRLRPLGVA